MNVFVVLVLQASAHTAILRTNVTVSLHAESQFENLPFCQHALVTYLGYLSVKGFVTSGQLHDATEIPSHPWRKCCQII